MGTVRSRCFPAGLDDAPSGWTWWHFKRWENTTLLPFGASSAAQVGMYIGKGLRPVLNKLANQIRQWEFLGMSQLLQEFWDHSPPKPAQGQTSTQDRSLPALQLSTGSRSILTVCNLAYNTSLIGKALVWKDHQLASKQLTYSLLLKSTIFAPLLQSWMN